MGISFKIARVGSRYTPKSLEINADSETENDNGDGDQEMLNEGRFGLIEDKFAVDSNKLDEPALLQVLEDLGASFSLNLFLNGFSFGKPTEVFNHEPEQLIPYDRASEPLFTAIEYGWLPGDIFDQIPCKYVNGAVLCEIQDYRNCLSQNAGTALPDTSPTLHKVLLHMCMENVVKDILSMLNESWSYEDLLDVESRILKALQPDLRLNPDPLLYRLLEESPPKKINLGIAWSWKKRKLNSVWNFNSQNGICLPSTGSTQESNIQKSSAYLSAEVPTSNENTSRDVSLQAYKVAQKNVQNHQSVHGCNKSAAASSSTSKIGRNQKETLPLVPSENRFQETVERTILKGKTKLPTGVPDVIVKQEPLETTDLLKSYISLPSSQNSDARAVKNLGSRVGSHVDCKPYLERFLKIETVTQRYGMNVQKRKMNQRMPKVLVFRTDTVAGRLENSEDRRMKYAATEKRIFRDDSGDKIKLVMSEMLNEGKVETSVVYQQKGRDYISLPLSPNCPSTHFADLCAAQFQSLLEKEGYHIAKYDKEPIVISSDGQSSSDHPDSESDTAACGSVRQSSPPFVTGLLSSTPPPMLSRISAPNTWQLPSQNIPSRSHILSGVNIQSPFQNLPSNLSKPHFNSAAQVSPMKPQWPGILNKHDHLQYQLMLSQRQQELLLEKKKLLEAVSAAIGGPCPIQLGGDFRGRGDAGMALGGPMNSLQRAQVPWIGNVGHGNGMMSDHPSSLVAKYGLGAPGTLGGGLMNPIPIPRSSGMANMRRPTIPDPVYALNNQLLPQPQIQKQLQMPYSQQQPGSFGDRASNPLGQVILQQLPGSDFLEWSTNSAAPETNLGDAFGFSHGWS